MPPIKTMINTAKIQTCSKALGLKKALLLIDLAKRSIGSHQAHEAYKLHLEQLLKEFDLATTQLGRVEQEVTMVLQQIPFAKKLLSIKGISEI
jgi:transposase